MDNFSQYRYPGARPFQNTDVDRLLFRGRAEETQTLFHLIRSEPVVVFFAKSGMGKTSMLNAGLSHLLREKQYFPIFLRCNTPDRQLPDALFEDIALAAENKAVDFVPGSTETLWTYFKTTEFWSSDNRLLVPVLILDQFEELFIFYSKEARTPFLMQLAEMLKPASALAALPANPEDKHLGSSPPEVKLLLTLREDYLAHLDELSPWMPSIFRDRFRLTELDLEAARAAIEEPARLENASLSTNRFVYAPEAIDDILRFLRQRRVGEQRVETNQIEPFQLQLICQHVETNLLGRTDQEQQISRAALGGEEGMKRVLRDFYDQQVRRISRGRDRRAAYRLCEKGLIIDGTQWRISRAEEEIKRQYRVGKPLLDRMIEARLLRAEPRLGSAYYELSHDTLVAPVLAARKRRKSRQLRTTLILGSLFLLTGLGAWQPLLKPWILSIQATPLEFVRIEAGSFEMGSDEGESDEQPVHTVVLSSAFDMGKYEVTQAQWARVMGTAPGYFFGAQLPVEWVSWEDVQEFLARLNEQEGCGGCYRLPTEAEWEYAARGGNDRRWDCKRKKNAEQSLEGEFPLVG